MNRKNKIQNLKLRQINCKRAQMRTGHLAACEMPRYYFTEKA